MRPELQIITRSDRRSFDYNRYVRLPTAGLPQPGSAGPPRGVSRNLAVEWRLGNPDSHTACVQMERLPALAELNLHYSDTKRHLSSEALKRSLGLTIQPLGK